MSSRPRTVQVGISACIVAMMLPITIGNTSTLEFHQLFTASCWTDEEISAKERSAADEAAMEFVQNALGPNPEAAYSVLTAEAKANVSLDEFTATFKKTIQRMAPFKELHVAHTYLAKVTGGTQAQAVVCGNLGSPAGWVAVTTKPGVGQAHVIVEAQTLNNSWAFVIWLLPEERGWKVLYFHWMVTAIVGKTADDLWHMAGTEQQKNHIFNAYILFTTAMQLSARGPNLQLGILPEIEKGLNDLKRSHDLQGASPFSWKFGQSTFNVLNVGPIGVNGKIYLLIDHEIEPWAADKDADKKNHDLISGFAEAHPEYKDAFSGLVVRAHERGGTRGFGTVSDNE